MEQYYDFEINGIGKGTILPDLYVEYGLCLDISSKEKTEMTVNGAKQIFATLN